MTDAIKVPVTWRYLNGMPAIFDADGTIVQICRVVETLNAEQPSPFVANEISAVCGGCGFRYFPHKGYIIACPVCRIEQVERRLSRLAGYSRLMEREKQI